MSPSINASVHPASSGASQRMLTKVLLGWGTVWINLHSEAPYSSALVFTNGKKEKISGSFQSCRRQCFIDLSYGERATDLKQ